MEYINNFVAALNSYIIKKICIYKCFPIHESSHSRGLTFFHGNFLMFTCNKVYFFLSFDTTFFFFNLLFLANLTKKKKIEKERNLSYNTVS